MQNVSSLLSNKDLVQDIWRIFNLFMIRCCSLVHFWKMIISVVSKVYIVAVWSKIPQFILVFYHNHTFVIQSLFMLWNPVLESLRSTIILFKVLFKNWSLDQEKKNLLIFIPITSHHHHMICVLFPNLSYSKDPTK